MFNSVFSGGGGRSVSVFFGGGGGGVGLRRVDLHTNDS